MEISKELKEKLLKANSEEEVNAILGDQATEEEITRTWQEIEHHRPAEGLEAVDDDELDAVSGGADRDWLTQGCAATVEYDSWCWSDDECTVFDVIYDNNEACPKGGGHEWMSFTAGLIPTPHRRCVKCGCEETLSRATGKPV